MYTKKGKVLVLLLHFFNFLKVIQAGWGKPSLGSIFISDVKSVAISIFSLLTKEIMDITVLVIAGLIRATSGETISIRLLKTLLTCFRSQRRNGSSPETPGRRMPRKSA